jgi:hypothetical protein
MATEKQILANRRNAQLSTGPRTDLGKTRASMNALKHGITAQQIVVPGEDPAAFDQHLEQVRQALQPDGALEEQLAERIAVCMWRLRRLYNIEAGIFSLSALESRIAAERDLAEARERDAKSATLNYFDLKEDDRYHEALEKAADLQRTLCERSDDLSSAFRHDAQGMGVFNKLSRYESHIERAMYRALHELERRQADRKGKAVVAPVVVDLEMSE